MKNNFNESLVISAIEKFSKEKNKEKLEKIIKDIHSSILYEYIKKIPQIDIVEFFHLINSETSARVFKEFSVEEQIELIKILENKEIEEIFNEYHTDESVDILEEYPYKVIQKVINTLELKERIKINRIFAFAKHQSGFHMTIDFVSISNGQTMKEARVQIRREISEKENEIIGNIFVIDEEKKLLGYITPDVMFVSRNTEKVDSLIREIDSVKLTDNISKAENIMSKFDVPSAPVVDDNGIIVGVIEAEDIIEQYEEIEESFLDSSNIKIVDESYMDLTSYRIFKSRVWWIIALLFIGSITQMIIMGFQVVWSNSGYWSGGSATSSIVITSIITLGFANSLSVASSVNDSAGNSGSQSSATIIRGLAMGEITKNDYGKVIKKEFFASILIGTSAAIASFVRMFLVWWLFGYFRGDNLANAADEVGRTVGWVIMWYSIIALIASVTFFIAIIIGIIIGAILPIIAHKRGSDGAIISGPVQTTIVDVLTFTVYLSITTAIFIPLANQGYFDPVTLDPPVTAISNLSIFSNQFNFLSSILD